MLERRDDYASLYGDFRWAIPDRFNIGVAVADRWAAGRPGPDGAVRLPRRRRAGRLSFGELAQRSNAFANALRARGIRRGDRVALLLPQCFETVIAHVAIYKLGAIAVPLALLFGVEALEYRLQTAGVKAVVTNAAGAAKLSRIAGTAARPRRASSSIDGDDGARRFRRARRRPSADLRGRGDTAPDDPAMMIFTSGTTGPPKGALHGHRVLLGHLPGFQMAYEFLPQPGDLMWTPADWAWAGGLLNALLPSLYLGVPVGLPRGSRNSIPKRRSCSWRRCGCATPSSRRRRCAC